MPLLHNTKDPIQSVWLPVQRNFNQNPALTQHVAWLVHPQRQDFAKVIANLSLKVC